MRQEGAAIEILRNLRGRNALRGDLERISSHLACFAGAPPLPFDALGSLVLGLIVNWGISDFAIDLALFLCAV